MSHTMIRSEAIKTALCKVTLSKIALSKTAVEYGLLGAVLVGIAIWPELAWAQNTNWTKPAEGIIDNLTSGLQDIGILVVGIGILAVGFMAALFGQMDWKRALWIIAGGILITSYSAITTLINTP